MAIVRALSEPSAWSEESAYGAADKRLLRFERLANRVSGNTNMLLIFRAKVPGGWLVVMRPNDSITFMPDPEHDWDGSSLP